MIAQLVERLPRSRVSWVRILPRAVVSLKKDKAVLGVYYIYIFAFACLSCIYMSGVLQCFSIVLCWMCTVFSLPTFSCTVGWEIFMSMRLKSNCERIIHEIS